MYIYISIHTYIYIYSMDLRLFSGCIQGMNKDFMWKPFKLQGLGFRVYPEPLKLSVWNCSTQRVLSTHMGNTYPNHKGNYYYRNHTLYHIGTLDPLGYSMVQEAV